MISSWNWKRFAERPLPRFLAVASDDRRSPMSKRRGGPSSVWLLVLNHEPPAQPGYGFRRLGRPASNSSCRAREAKPSIARLAASR